MGDGTREKAFGTLPSVDRPRVGGCSAPDSRRLAGVERIPSARRRCRGTRFPRAPRRSAKEAA